LSFVTFYNECALLGLDGCPIIPHFLTATALSIRIPFHTPWAKRGVDRILPHATQRRANGREKKLSVPVIA
jgi:hypothetical protein